MGVAAYNRGSASIRREASAAQDERQAHADRLRATRVAAECDEFTRSVLAYLAEPAGLRRQSIEAAKTRRGWAPRNAALVTAHNAWVAGFGAIESVRRAQAAYALLKFALGSYTVPAHIAVPRAAI